MQIDKESVITLHYTLTDDAGNELETTRHGEPLLYLQGSGGLLPALEEALQGRQAGDTFRLELSAADAYGERKPAAVERVPAKYLAHEGRLRPGQVAYLHLREGGAVPVTVMKVGKFSVDVDRNHPYAGLGLNFDVTVADVRAATPEELAHGHAHGVGGHQH
ncbi:MAG: peptidylprolyl isomerase [Spongiibacteraceae bacterium]|jgi:FKBP-type peptidyl-prolyl cis-trans isomerase SlyD|nr:peptidylprolyl isomerase [Spongiibacteraceae bacterium]